MRLLLVLIILSAGACNARDQSVVEKVESLGLQSVNSSVTAYYSDRYRQFAEHNVQLLKNADDFFEEQFGVRQSFSIAVLDSASWRQITDIPYGLPFVSGPPYIVCLPANAQNTLSETISEAIDGYDLEGRYGTSREEIVGRFVSLIGFHELGHMYARAYGIRFPNKWTFEFAATYLAYYYLDQNFPAERDLWLEVSRVLARELAPRYTTLQEFEQWYVGVGVANYAWYQVAFLLQVQEVYEKSAKAFIRAMRDYPWPVNSASDYLPEMDSISPGFVAWAEKYQLQ